MSLFVFKRNYRNVPVRKQELCNGAGDEQTLLKAAQLKAQLTQDEVAERIGITTHYLMAIENEGKCPTLDVWFRLIRTLHTSADGIIYPENTEDTEQSEQLLYMIRSLSSRDKKIVQVVIQTMLDNQ